MRAAGAATVGAPGRRPRPARSRGVCVLADERRPGALTPTRAAVRLPDGATATPSPPPPTQPTGKSESTRAKVAARLAALNADPERPAPAAAPAPARPKRCSHCGETGHNRKTCPRLLTQTTAEAAAPSTAPAEAADAASEASEAARKSRYRGVTWSRAHRMWRAQVWDGARVRFVGIFPDEADAARAFDAAAVALRGVESAARSLNFPEEAGVAAREFADAPPGTASPPPTVFPLPLSQAEAIDQAADAVLRAWRDGATRLRVDFLLPDADADGARARFAAARDMAEAVLTLVKNADPALSGRLTPRWLDDAEPVGAWVGDALAAALLPTADTVPALQALAADAPSRLLLAFNPAWDGAGPKSRGGGNLVSDFGYGAAGAAAEAFAASFAPAACTRRIVVSGDDVRLHVVHGGAWQTHYMWPNGRGHLLIGADTARPSYDRVAALAKKVPGSRSGRPWTARLGGALQRAEDEDVAAEAAAVPPPKPVVESSTPQPLAATTPSPSPSSDRFAVDIITGAPVRDVRLDPVLQWARWLGGGEGGREPPSPRARREGDDAAPTPTPKPDAAGQQP